MPPRREIIDAPDAPAALGPYGHAVRSGDLLFCSGQIPLDVRTGEISGATAAEQESAESKLTGRTAREPRCGVSLAVPAATHHPPTNR